MLKQEPWGSKLEVKQYCQRGTGQLDIGPSRMRIKKILKSPLFLFHRYVNFSWTAFDEK